MYPYVNMDSCCAYCNQAQQQDIAIVLLDNKGVYNREDLGVVAFKSVLQHQTFKRQLL